MYATIEVGRYCHVKIDLGRHRRTVGQRFLVVHLVVDLMVGLGTAPAKEVLNILEGLDGND